MKRLLYIVVAFALLTTAPSGAQTAQPLAAVRQLTWEIVNDREDARILIGDCSDTTGGSVAKGATRSFTCTISPHGRVANMRAYPAESGKALFCWATGDGNATPIVESLMPMTKFDCRLDTTGTNRFRITLNPVPMYGIQVRNEFNTPIVVKQTRGQQCDVSDGTLLKPGAYTLFRCKMQLIQASETVLEASDADGAHAKICTATWLTGRATVSPHCHLDTGDANNARLRIY